MNIFVGNLSCTVGEADLEVLFHDVADIVFARLLSPREPDPDARGYAFLAFFDDMHARSAIDTLDGVYFKGTRLIVRHVGRAPSHTAPVVPRARPRLRVIRGRRAANG